MHGVGENRVGTREILFAFLPFSVQSVRLCLFTHPRDVNGQILQKLANLNRDHGFLVYSAQKI